MDVVNFQAYPNVEWPPLLQETANRKHGDYQCNSAMGLANVRLCFL